MKVPEQGDIVLLDFDPQAGHEQAGHRPGLVVSQSEFNQVTGFIFVVPVTNQIKNYPFEVPISGTKKTKGVALADQVKSLDAKARRCKVVDRVNKATLDRALDLITVIMGR